MRTTWFGDFNPSNGLRGESFCTYIGHCGWPIFACLLEISSNYSKATARGHIAFVSMTNGVFVSSGATAMLIT